MNDSHNFTSTWKKYLESRGIKENSIENLGQKGLIKYEQEFISFTMKDLDWNIVWEQQRFINPDKGKLKSKTKHGTKVWYFYTNIDRTKPVIVVEWEIDRLSIVDLPNVIWLQGIANFKKLIHELKSKWASEIYFVVDNDESADRSIGMILDMDNSFLSNVFDARWILWEYKDINDYVCAGWVITLDNIYQYAKSLWDFKKLIDSFLLKGNVPRINHNEFAKYIIRKFTIASSKENLFVYNYRLQKWIRQPLDKQQMKKIIIMEMESALSHAITNFKTTDLNSIFDFIISHSKDDDLEDWLMFPNQEEICLSDWILDIQTMETRPYMKEDYKFQNLRYSSFVFKSYTEPTRFLLFLGQILDWFKEPDKIVSFVQEFIGLLFVSNTKFEKALLLYWPWGNGKGVLLWVIKELLWPSNCANIGLHEINKDQYLFNLIGKVANIDSDMQQNVQLDSGIIKKLISWESISAKTVYKQPIEFVPYARLLIATNELPYIKTIDNSIRRRFIFIHLKKSFYGKENPNLIKEILEEKDNIFVWAMHGLKRLLDRDNFIIPTELNDELESFIKENDTVELFFDDGIVIPSDKEKIYYRDIYFLYRNFCNESGYKALSKRNFNRRVKDRGFDEEFRDATWRGFIWLKRNIPF